MSSPSAASAAPGDRPGELFFAEIREQPDALRRLLEHEAEYSEIARTIADRRPSLIRLVGHGSSDNAATYGVYAFGLLPRMTAVRDSISLSVYYGAELDFSASVVVALSQSGRTPDVVEYVRSARELGAPLEDALTAATAVPAGVISEPVAGRLDVGLPADLLVLDDNLEIERVLIGGEARVVA